MTHIIPIRYFISPEYKSNVVVVVGTSSVSGQRGLLLDKNDRLSLWLKRRSNTLYNRTDTEFYHHGEIDGDDGSVWKIWHDFFHHPEDPLEGKLDSIYTDQNVYFRVMRAMQIERKKRSSSHIPSALRHFIFKNSYTETEPEDHFVRALDSFFGFSSDELS